MFSANPVTPTVTDTSIYSTSFMGKDVRNDPKKLGGQFEAIFYRTMLKQMRDAQLEEDPFENGMGAGQIRTMMDDELANVLGQRGYLGIGDMIAKQQALHGGSK